MRSRHADHFNHDADAPGYDADVRNERDPIREGYAALLDWAAASLQLKQIHRVLELGAGTGNLTKLLGAATEIVAVDVSQQMLQLAQAKIANGVTWVACDLLEYFDSCTLQFDGVVSTYAVHHLAADEKRLLFQQIRNCLKPGGLAVFGDLMFESADAQRAAQRRYRDTGFTDVATAIDEEFFWLLDDCVPALERLGFDVTTKRFSDLSWGVCAVSQSHK